MRRSIFLVAAAIFLGMILLAAVGYYSRDSGVSITGNVISIHPQNNGSYFSIGGAETEEEWELARELVEEVS